MSEKQFANSPEKKEIVLKFLNQILSAHAAVKFMEEVYENEELYKDNLEVILNKAKWWFYGDVDNVYKLETKPLIDDELDYQCEIYHRGGWVGTVDISQVEAEILGLCP